MMGVDVATREVKPSRAKPTSVLAEVLIEADPNLMVVEAQSISKRMVDTLEDSGYTVTKTKAPIGLLIAMALLVNPGFLDNEKCSPAKRRSILRRMKQVHDEVTGLGGYAPENDRDFQLRMKRADEESEAAQPETANG